MLRTLDKKSNNFILLLWLLLPMLLLQQSLLLFLLHGIRGYAFSPLVESLSMQNTKVHFPFTSVAFSISHALTRAFVSILIRTMDATVLNHCKWSLLWIFIWTPVWMFCYTHEFISWCVWCKPMSPQLHTFIQWHLHTHSHMYMNIPQRIAEYAEPLSAFELCCIG